jgi:signal transduction histidine kinase
MLCLILFETKVFYGFLIPPLVILTCWSLPVMRGSGLLTLSDERYRALLVFVAVMTIALVILSLQLRGADAFPIIWRMAMPVTGSMVGIFLLWRYFKILLVSARIMLAFLVLLMFALVLLLLLPFSAGSYDGQALFFNYPPNGDRFWVGFSWFFVLTLSLLVLFLLMKLAYERFAAEARLLQTESQKQAGRLTWSKRMSELDRQRSLGLLSSSIQHELRQPLAAMHLNSQIFSRQLKRDNELSEYAMDAVRDVLSEAQRFQHRVRGVGQFVSAKTFSSIDVSVAQEIEEAVNLIQPELGAAKVSIALDLDPSIYFHCVSVDLRHAMLHLMMNAYESVRLNPEDCERCIEVSLSADQEAICLEVTDSGAGMSEGQIAAAGLEAFSTKPYRVGLGLLMVKTFLDRHGGTWSFRKSETRFGVAVVLSRENDERVTHV